MIPQIPTTAIIQWAGEDLDSSDPNFEPVAYEDKLADIMEPFDPDDVIIDALIGNENLLWEGGGSSSEWLPFDGTENELRIEGLPAGESLAFGIRAIDEAGATSRVLHARSTGNARCYVDWDWARFLCVSRQ